MGLFEADKKARIEQDEKDSKYKVCSSNLKEIE
jgi:hypothetical protein